MTPSNKFDIGALSEVSSGLSSETTVDPRPPISSDPPLKSSTRHESDPATAFVRRSDYVELPPGSVVGEIYEIDTRLGVGAMGEVYAAHHMKLGKRVAIKVIGRRLSEDAAAIERFAMEAKTLAQVQHPAIVAVEHVGELPDGRAYFVMEFLRGESLFERLARGRLPLREALRVLDQMARGLEAAHQSGVTHRDLKPENVFLVHLAGEEPAVKLLDFGLAKLQSMDDQRAERTQSGVAIGTPMYMSPEQARGPDVDHRTDIYALGCVAYELVLGRPPFPHARTAPEFWAAHLAEAPPLPRSIWPEIPPQLDLVLFAMVAKDPAHRPTLTQVRSVITDVRTGTRSQRAATEFVGKRAASPKTWTFAVGILALVVGIAVGAIVMSRSSSSIAEPPRLATPQAPIAPTIVPIPAPTPVPAPAPTPPIAPAPATKEISAPRIRPHNDERRTSPMPRPQRSSSATIAPPTSPTDAGGSTTTTAPQDTTPPKSKTPPWPDRNQTINPFAKHKVNQ